MRVTNKMIAGTLTNNIQRSMEKLARTQEQLSTGLRIIRPSDDPPVISPLLAIKAVKQANEQYVRNIDDGLTYLNMADTALGSISDILKQAKEYALQGANDPLREDDRQDIAKQIDKMIDNLVDLGNSTVGSKYLFAGMKNAEPPFERRKDADGTDVGIFYKGDLKRITREVINKSSYEVDAPGITTETDANKYGVFGKGVLNGTEYEVTEGIFKTMFDLRDRLNKNDTTGLQTSLGELDSQLNHILRQRVGVGARTNHFESVKNQLLDQDVRLTEVEDTLESADMAKVSIAMGQQQLAYNASLSAGSMILQTSLVNFLK